MRYNKNPQQAETATKALREMLGNVMLTNDYSEAYAYRDANGNYYELNFGLSY